MEALRDVLAALFIETALFERSEFAVSMNAFSRQVISLVFLDSEAVPASDFLYTSEHILYFTLFVFR